MNNLFVKNYEEIKPLAAKLRPEKIIDFIGQDKLMGKNGILKKLIETDSLGNSIFFGPPGCGKTTLGEIISKLSNKYFVTLNATIASLDDLREVVENAKKNLEYYGKRTILFLDEIHRFNKKQQDALLSYCENGVLTLIGATTENPYYSLNNALLSRVMIFEFKALTRDNVKTILENAMDNLNIIVPDEIKNCILDIAQGDGRIALNYLELYYNSCKELSLNEVIEIFRERQSSYHKEEDKYNLISALIKSMRGSDPDSALYWLARLLEGGEDPRYIARRIVILASEDIGMANPEALTIATNTMIASERIGMPEIRIILSQAVIYMAISSKSNSCYKAINLAMEDVKNGDLENVPINIAHNHQGYKYPHDYGNNFVRQKYSNKKRKYYFPNDNKNEKMIKDKMKKLWEEN